VDRINDAGDVEVHQRNVLGSRYKISALCTAQAPAPFGRAAGRRGRGEGNQKGIARESTRAMSR
jgi:hypothetical protein